MKFTQDWFTYNVPHIERLMGLLPERKRFLEIGCFEGRATCWFLEHGLDEHGMIVCIDPFEGSMEHSDLDLSDIWILNEGHCLRNQVINICGERKKDKHQARFDYQTGSVETLKRIVEQDDGVTILPEMSVMDMSDDQMELVRYFKSPEPVREISMFTHRDFVKKKLIRLYLIDS